MNHFTAILLSILSAGIIGIYLGSILNMEGYLGIVAAIAVAGANIVKAIDEKR